MVKERLPLWPEAAKTAVNYSGTATMIVFPDGLLPVTISLLPRTIITFQNVLTRLNLQRALA